MGYASQLYLNASRKLQRRGTILYHSPTHVYIRIHIRRRKATKIVFYALRRLSQLSFGGCRCAHAGDHRVGLNGVLRCAVEDPTRIIPETPQVSRKFARKVSRETLASRKYPSVIFAKHYAIVTRTEFPKIFFVSFCYLNILQETNKIE